MGINAAPLNRSLGIGIHWLIRELFRRGVYEAKDQQLMAPYCWVPTGRVRKLIQLLGGRVGEVADRNGSRAIYDFVVAQIGADFARFEGDFDLPFQIITKSKNRQILEDFFKDSGAELPIDQYRSFSEDWED
jgi:hypothetical protein